MLQCTGTLAPNIILINMRLCSVGLKDLCYTFTFTVQLMISVVESKNLFFCNSLQQHTGITDMCMFHEIRNNFDNIAIYPMLVESIIQNCHFNHIHLLYSDALK